MVGSRSCSSSIYSGRTWNGVAGDKNLTVGPVIFGALLDGSADASPQEGVADATVLIVKSPLTVGPTSGNEVEVSLESTGDLARLVYDDAGFAALNDRSFEFAPAVRSVKIPTAFACGHGVDGFEQFNGGFVASGPTCARVTVAV